MPLNIPENDEKIISRGLADIQRELPSSRPFTKNHWIKAIATGVLKRIFDFYVQLNLGINELFADTSEVFAERWAAIYGKQRREATKANGYIVATGTATTTLSAGTTISSSTGAIYVTLADATINSQTINIQDLTRTGTTVTVTFSSAHNLASGVSVTIASAADAEYNITALITVTSLTEFEYEISGTPSDEIGTMATATFITGHILVESEAFGSNQNLSAGSILTLESPLPGVDEELTVDFGGISGGSDIETKSRLRARTLDKIQNPVAQFNVAAIREQAFSIADVTRVFVQPVTPAIGQVTIYFMTDNRSSPIPVSADLTNVKNQILTIKPANTSDSDVIVSSPTAVPTAFTFSSLSPDSSAMRQAITANLRQFYAEQTQVGVNVDEDAYRSAIYNTINPSTGDRLVSFTLSAPSGDITIASGEIGTLGAVTYP